MTPMTSAATAAVVGHLATRAFTCRSRSANGSIVIIAGSASPSLAMNPPTQILPPEQKAAQQLGQKHPPTLCAWPLLALIHTYRLVLSPLLGPRCRYLPSCSEYALTAITEHGAWNGGLLALRRILRCHPWGGSGHDPVPPAR